MLPRSNILRRFHILVIICTLPIFLVACLTKNFDGEQALRHIEKQVSFGYRIPGTKASMETSDYIKKILEQNGWEILFQDFSYKNVPIRNIIAIQNKEVPDIIIGAHYDTRQISDQETEVNKKRVPVIGANDGASGTAVLMELSRHLRNSNKNIWLVFFDAEDQGRISDWPWSVGAEYFAANLDSYPKAVIIVDMIGDKELRIFKESNSDPELTAQIWEKAVELGFKDYFINSQKYTLLDDHTPFINRGIPACLIIDFDYPHWHTNEDSIDKVSCISLSIVGNTLLDWISSLE